MVIPYSMMSLRPESERGQVLTVAEPYLSRLDPLTRDVIVMHIRGVRQVEIAKVLGIAPPSLHLLFWRGLGFLGHIRRVPRFTRAAMVRGLNPLLSPLLAAAAADFACLPSVAALADWHQVRRCTLHARMSRAADLLRAQGVVTSTSTSQGLAGVFLFIYDHRALLGAAGKSGYRGYVTPDLLPAIKPKVAGRWI